MFYLKKLTVNILIVVISIVIFLILAEITTRLLFTPGKSDARPRLEGYTINKPPEVTRILVLGDSIAYGWGINREETFSKRLEEMLNEGFPSQNIEVINTGIPNINTEHELNILKNKGAVPVYPQSISRGYVGMAYDPDLILISYNLNDNASSTIKGANRTRNLTIDTMIHGNLQFNTGSYALPLPRKVDSLLSKKSKFYRFFLVRYDRFLNKIGLRRDLPNILLGYDDNAAGWMRTKQALYNIVRIGKKNGVKTCIFIWPSLIKDMNKKYPYKNIHKKIIDFSTSSVMDIPTFDLLEIFTDYNGEKFHAGTGDPHPNAEAHMMAAEAMYKFIIERQLLPKR